MKKPLLQDKFAQLLVSCLLGAVTVLSATAINSQELNALDDERSKQLQELGVLLPNPQVIRETAQQEFAKPLASQDVEVLEQLSKDANSYSNLVSKITDEYNDYIRENSRYDFVTEEVKKAPVVAEYLSLDSEFKTIRNRAYLNLGRIALSENQQMKAFLLFNDAYRLSVFSCGDGIEGCVRYEAEQYMKELLDIVGESYVDWQK